MMQKAKLLLCMLQVGVITVMQLSMAHQLTSVVIAEILLLMQLALALSMQLVLQYHSPGLLKYLGNYFGCAGG